MKKITTLIYSKIFHQHLWMTHKFCRRMQLPQRVKLSILLPGPWIRQGWPLNQRGSEQWGLSLHFPRGRNFVKLGAIQRLSGDLGCQDVVVVDVVETVEWLGRLQDRRLNIARQPEVEKESLKLFAKSKIKSFIVYLGFKFYGYNEGINSSL